MRTYEQTHPWLTFGLDLGSRHFGSKLWLALGEAASKCDHIAGVPLAPEVANRMHRLYLAKGALATTAIEGNTLSEEEVERYLDGNLKLPPSQQYLTQEIDNIVAACNELTNRIAKDGYADVSVELLNWMNEKVLQNLVVDEGVIPGKIREHRVIVGKYRCAPPEDCEYLLAKFCETLNSFPIPPSDKTAYSIIKAIFAHLYLVWIHPYGDGNGRTARMLELYILLAAGSPQPTGHLLSNHYNKTRTMYYRHLENAVKSEADFFGFFRYAIEGFVDGVRGLIASVREQQMKVAWINYVHEQFGSKRGPVAQRQRDLLLALSSYDGAFSVAKLTEKTPEVMALYANRGPRTLGRDIRDLLNDDFLDTDGTDMWVRKERIQAFLPWRNKITDPRMSDRSTRS